jgi:CheY-like chemotaxis protein
MLLLFGYEVVQAKDGDEALVLYRHGRETGVPVHLVIMDLTIPGAMGGKETISRLLEIDPAAKAIVSSGYANDPVMANYRDYGFRAVISKPFQIQALNNMIAQVLAEKGV